MNSDHDWWTVNRGCVHGDLQPSFPTARQALRARGKPSTPTLPSYCQIICEKTCEILWLWEAESNKPLGKVSKSFDSFALEGVIPAGCQLEEKKHRDDEFNANTLHEWLSCHIQTKVILILTLITCLKRHLWKKRDSNLFCCSAVSDSRPQALGISLCLHFYNLWLNLILFFIILSCLVDSDQCFIPELQTYWNSHF